MKLSAPRGEFSAALIDALRHEPGAALPSQDCHHKLVGFTAPADREKELHEP